VDLLVIQDHRVILVLEELKEKMAFVELKETKETEELMDLPDLKEIWDQKETKVLKDLQDPEEKTVLTVSEAAKDLEANQVQLVLSVKRVKWVFLDYQDIPEELGKRVELVHKVPEEELVLRANGVLKENVDNKVDVGLKDREVSAVCVEALES